MPRPLIVAVALTGATAAAAQTAAHDRPGPAGDVDMARIATGEAMASHEPMPGAVLPKGRKATPAELKKRHDAMMRRDALKPDAMKSSMPQ
jgi:hypothetical protein